MKNVILWVVGAIVVAGAVWYVFKDRVQTVVPEPLPPLVVTDFEGEADPSRMTLSMNSWKWISAQYNDGTEVRPKKEGAFVLTFDGKGNFSTKTDCNSLGGKYGIDQGGDTIEFFDIVSTQMFCQDSQEGDFVKLLMNIGSYHFTSKGELIFELKFDSGVVIFR